MSVTEMVLETIQALPAEQQQQVLEYAQALQKNHMPEPTEQRANSFLNHPAFGMWKDRDDMKDVKEWRQQLWRKD
ncbi:MAG: DUF2281 domain-containing protein [Cyanobacteria bacterium J06581_3]